MACVRARRRGDGGGPRLAVAIGRGSRTARCPSFREVWVNAMAEFCDALTWEMVTPQEREINLAIDARMARRRLRDSAVSATA